MQTTLTRRQGLSLVALFVIGSTLYIQTSQPAKQDTWITLLLAAAAAIPFLLIYCRIMALFPGMSLYDIFYRLFGKWAGAALTAIYVLFFLHMEVLIVQMFVQFNRINILPTTPLFVIGLPICLLASWLATVGHTRLGRAAATMLFAVIITLTFTFVASTSNFNLDICMPILKSETEVLVSSTFSFFAVPMTQTAVFLCILHNMKSSKEQRFALIFGLILGTIYIGLSIVRSIFLLGGDTLAKLYYTSFLAASVIRIDSFIQRIETVISFAFIIATLFKLSIYCYAAKEGIKKLVPRVKLEWLIAPTAIAVALCAALIFDNTEASFAWADIMRQYATVFQLAIPVVLWICGEIVTFRSRMKKYLTER